MIDRNIENINVTRHISNKKNTLESKFKDIDSIDGLLSKAKEILKGLKKKDSKIAINALRLIIKEKVGELTDDKDAFIKIDKDFLNSIESKNVEIQGDAPRTKEDQTSRKRSAEEDPPLEDQPDVKVSVGGEEEEEEETKEENPGGEPVVDDEVEMQDDASMEVNPTENGEQQEVEVLPEIELTHPDDIHESNAPVTDHPLQQVELEDSDTLPPGVVPEGENAAEDFTPTIDPATLEQPQIPLEEQPVDLPDFEDLSDVEIEQLDEDDVQVVPTSVEGFDNNGESIVVIHEPTSAEMQSMVIDAMFQTARQYTENDQQARDAVMYLLDQEETLDVPIQEEETQEMEVEPQPSAISKGETPGVSEPQAAEEMDVEQPPQETPEVEMKDPSQQMIKAQERERKQTDIETIREQKKIEKMSIQQGKEEQKRLMDVKIAQDKEYISRGIIQKAYRDLLGLGSGPLNEADNKKLDKRILEGRKNHGVLTDYIVKMSLKRIQEIKVNREGIRGMIESGHVRAMWDAKQMIQKSANKDISKEIAIQSDKEREIVKKNIITRAIDAKYIQRTSDIIAEVGDYTARNIQRIQQQLDPSNAISKYVYPSYRDPATFNVVKYRVDPNGQIIINKETGQPIIQSISAVSRDDSKKLIEQRQAVDATDTPSPYYPLYGKQARRFFSKNEYSYLGRLFQGPAGAPRGSIPRPLDMKKEINTMIHEMGDSLEIKDKNLKGNVLFKQWAELEVLKNSFHRYNQFSDYQYVQDKKELQQDGTLMDPDATESAAKMLQSITVQKLLDLLANKQRQEAQLSSMQGTMDAQASGQSKPELGQDEMDISKNPADVGADVPPDDSAAPIVPGQEEEKDGVNLTQWISTESSYNPPIREVYRYSDSLAAWGGEETKMKD